jgi:N-glycosylase/DNA lyase
MSGTHSYYDPALVADDVIRAVELHVEDPEIRRRVFVSAMQRRRMACEYRAEITKNEQEWRFYIEDAERLRRQIRLLDPPKTTTAATERDGRHQGASHTVSVTDA